MIARERGQTGNGRQQNLQRLTMRHLCLSSLEAKRQKIKKHIIEAALGVEGHCQDQRLVLPWMSAARSSRVSISRTLRLQSLWVMHHTWQLYLMLSLSTVSLFNKKGKELKSSRDNLNIKVIQMIPSTWDHSHKHFRKGCLNALCICYFFFNKLTPP